MCATVNAPAAGRSKAASRLVSRSDELFESGTEAGGCMRHAERPEDFGAHKVRIRRPGHSSYDFVEDIEAEIGVVVSLTRWPEEDAITINRFIDRERFPEIE